MLKRVIRSAGICVPCEGQTYRQGFTYVAVGAGGAIGRATGTAAYGCPYPITYPFHNYSGSSSGYGNATPDQVKMCCGRPEPISDGLLGRPQKTPSSRLVCTRVWCMRPTRRRRSVGVGGYWSWANLYVYAPKVLSGWDFGVCRSVRHPPLGAAVIGAGLYAGYWIRTSEKSSTSRHFGE